MQRIKQTKQDFIVLLSETKETLDEQLALPQAERDAALIAECLETLDYIKGEANLPEGAFVFDSFQFFARNSSPSILFSLFFAKSCPYRCNNAFDSAIRF